MLWVSRLSKIVAIALVVWIVFVVVAPGIDLPNGTIRTQTALTLLMTMVGVVAAAFAMPRWKITRCADLRFCFEPEPHVSELTCVRLC
jgi:predicted ABC-type sugar transport system permease subunit